jgi:hypothetical protein
MYHSSTSKLPNNYLSIAMSIGGYKIRDKEGIHFITFAVVQWVDLPTGRQVYLQEKNTVI